MAHEKSITLEIGPGSFANFKTVFGGKQVSDRDVMRMHREGRLKPLRGRTFKSSGEAVDAASKRSRSFNSPRGPLSSVKRRP